MKGVSASTGGTVFDDLGSGAFDSNVSWSGLATGSLLPEYNASSASSLISHFALTPQGGGSNNPLTKPATFDWVYTYTPPPPPPPTAIPGSFASHTIRAMTAAALWRAMLCIRQEITGRCLGLALTSAAAIQFVAVLVIDGTKIIILATGKSTLIAHQDTHIGSIKTATIARASQSTSGIRATSASIRLVGIMARLTLLAQSRHRHRVPTCIPSVSRSRLR